jgi:hypothetical protein
VLLFNWKRHTRLLLTASLPFLAVASALSQANAPEHLDNAAVVKMVQAHLSSRIIIAQIKNSAGAYLLTPPSLIRLKQQGVSDSIIEAMQDKQTTSAQPVAPAAANHEERRAAGRTSRGWKIANFGDELSNGPGVLGAQAVLGTQTQDGGHYDFRVTATCEADAVQMNLTYLKGDRSDPRSLIQGNFIQVKLDDGPLVSTLGSLISNDMNAAAIDFKFPGNGGPHNLLGSAQSTMNSLVGLISDMNDVPNAPMQFANELFHSQNLKVRLEMSGGEGLDFPIVTINLQDPQFRAFLNRCSEMHPSMKSIPKPPPPARKAPFPDLKVGERVIVARKLDGVVDMLNRDCVVEAGTMGQVIGFNSDMTTIAGIRPATRSRNSNCGATFSASIFDLERDDGSHQTLPVRPKAPPPVIMGNATAFSGSMQEFAAALDGFIVQAAQKVGAPPRSWAFEEKAILDTARLCAGVTAQMADSPTFHIRQNVGTVIGGYSACGAAYGIGIPEPPNASGKPAKSIFFLSIQPVGNWGNGQGMRLGLSFTGTGFPGTQDKNNMSNYGVLSAQIQGTP